MHCNQNNTIKLKGCSGRTRKKRRLYEPLSEELKTELLCDGATLPGLIL
jgi:hypothetical protein